MHETCIRNNPSGSATMSPDLPMAKNYFQWIASAIKPYLGTNILDIGSGYGIHLEYILPSHPFITSIDLSVDIVMTLRQKFCTSDHFQAYKSDFEEESNLEWLMRRGFDSIICLNVLEHLQDDISALERMYKILSQQRGIAMLMVPAHQWLYGSMDKQAGHFRRYTTATLGNMLRKAGFEILQLYHFNFFGVIPWFVNNRILKNKLDGREVGPQIRMFDAYVVPLMRRIEARVKFPIGQSIISVARVKHD